MIDAAEQIFEKPNGEFSSLIWLAWPRQAIIFLIHDHGTWKGWPDQWDGEIVRLPHPGTERGFAFLIEKAGLGPLLGEPIRGEQPYQTEVSDEPWEFRDSYGRALRLEWPGMNVHLDYPA